MNQTILLVEDEEDLRDLLAVELCDNAFQVIEAESGKDALEKLASNSINMVITDLRMAGGDGFELLAAVKIRDGAEVRTILMSGFADCTDQQAKELGADYLLHKPFSLSDFIKIVKSLLH